MRFSFLFFLVLVFVGCATKHPVLHTQSEAYPKHTKASDSLYFLASDDVKQHYPKSGFYPLQNNLDAFMARVFLIQNAKKTLDLQYFIFAEDETAYGITQLLVEAADRGVHVRVLIDDLLKKDSDVEIEALAQHPNIEIKLFNPTSFRKLTGWLQTGFHIDTLGRRMHNKLLIADNSAFVIGGRNIENIYFAADKESIFIDNDVLVIGPLSVEASNEFELYWHTPIAKDIKEVSKGEKRKEYEILKKKLFKNAHSLRYNAYTEEALSRAFAKSALSYSIPLIYANAKIYYDIPTKITTSEDDTSTHLSKDILPYFLNAKHTIRIINPYFIPNEKMLKNIAMLRKKGVEIYILTNSLATNDGIPVYSAYARSHKKLLKLGVHLFELNPKSFEYIYKKQKYRKGSIPRSSLHAKNLLIDDEIFIIGSANMDPRSIKLNTEVVAVIHSKELAKIEAGVFREVTKAKNVFRLELEPVLQEYECSITCIRNPQERVVWITEENGKEVRYYNDGNAGFFRRFESQFFNFLPILDKYL